ncbi:MAG: hypothetical protein RLN74_01170, partial [Ilumatobacter fluminis]
MRLLPATVAAIAVLSIAAPTADANPDTTTTTTATPTSAPDEVDDTVTTTTGAASTVAATPTTDPGNLAESDTVTDPLSDPLIGAEITSAPSTVIAGEPFTISGICTLGAPPVFVSIVVSTADVTQPNWFDQILSVDDKPAGSTVLESSLGEIDGTTFTHTFETSDVVRTVHIGVTCDQEPCSDVIGQGCWPIRPVAAATVNIVAPGTEIPTTVPGA